jgi:hypothetical protein
MCLLELIRVEEGVRCMKYFEEGGKAEANKNFWNLWYGMTCL